jgi:hypothetical protein
MQNRFGQQFCRDLVLERQQTKLVFLVFLEFAKTDFAGPLQRRIHF